MIKLKKVPWNAFSCLNQSGEHNRNVNLGNLVQSKFSWFDWFPYKWGKWHVKSPFLYVCRRSRWFILPWLIYDMLMVVGLSLVAVLLIVIPMGSFNSDHNWLIIGLKACFCLAVAGLFLYFWIVVLELFLKMGPFLMFDPAMMPPVPPANYPLMYPNTQMYPPIQYAAQGVPAQQQMYASGQYGRQQPL